MKNVIMFAIALIVICFGTKNVHAQQLKFEVDDTLYICAYNGLNLRASASTSAEVITKLDHADEVIVLEIVPEVLEIDHRYSSWIKVESAGFTGFLFGGYLSAIEPLYLDAYSYDCNTDLYYLDWVREILGDTPMLSHDGQHAKKKRSGSEIETTNYKAYASGDVFYNKVGPSTDSYYFESKSITYNDVLNFMEYLVACQNRFCSLNTLEDTALFRPIKNRFGQLVRVDCTTPLSMTAQQRGGKMVVKLETCL